MKIIHIFEIEIITRRKFDLWSLKKQIKKEFLLLLKA